MMLWYCECKVALPFHQLLEPYTYEQFYQITVGLLTKQHKVKEEIAEATANAIWDKSANVRDCVKIGRMARSLEDVIFIVDNFLRHNHAKE